MDNIRPWCMYWTKIEDAGEGIPRRAHQLCVHLYAADLGIDGESLHTDNPVGDALSTLSWLVSSCATGLLCFDAFLPRLWTMANETESSPAHAMPQSP